MFWEIVSEDVLEAPDKNVSADYEREWRVKKDEMEKATGTVWPDFGVESTIAAVKRGRIKGFWEKFWWTIASFNETSTASTHMLNPKQSSPMP